MSLMDYTHWVNLFWRGSKTTTNMATSNQSTLNVTVGDGMITSTPVTAQRTLSHRHTLSHEPSLDGITVEETEDSVVIDSAGPSAATSTVDESPDHDDVNLLPGHVAVPIMGYEVMEERSRFTVFRIQVKQGYDDSWFIFRRYSDFDHLNQKLKVLFPHFRLALPPKKWFGDNFDRNFLEDRILGLQAFLNNIIGHKEILNSEPVKTFFCIEDPPGPHDSLEESRALCETLEEQVFALHQSLTEKDNSLERMEAELSLMKIQIENLRKALRIECKLYSSVLPKAEKIHGDHVLNLVLLDVLERAKSSAMRRPVLSTTIELPEDEASDSPFSTGSSSQEVANLTKSMAAMETISMAALKQQEQQQQQQQLKTNNNIPIIKTPTTHTATEKRSAPKTGTGQLRSNTGLEPSQGVETVVASSSPTPKRANPAPSRELMSPGAHSVDVKVPRRRHPSDSGRHSSDSALPTLKEEDGPWAHEPTKRDSVRGSVHAGGDIRHHDMAVRPKVKTKVTPQ